MPPKFNFKPSKTGQGKQPHKKRKPPQNASVRGVWRSKNQNTTKKRAPKTKGERVFTNEKSKTLISTPKPPSYRSITVKLQSPKMVIILAVVLRIIVPHSDMSILRIQNSSPVRRAVHPGVHHLLRRSLSRCHVLTPSSVNNTVFFKGVKSRCAVRANVVGAIVHCKLLSPYRGYGVQYVKVLKRR